MSDDVTVKFGAETTEASNSITQLREVLRGLTAPIQGIRQNLGELAEAFVAAFAVEKLSEFFEKMAELGTQTERTAAMLGISTEEVGKLSAVALASGGSADSMTHAMERLALSLQHAQTGTGPAAAALKALGLSAQDLIGKPLPAVLDILANKFAGMGDGLNKTAIAMALLGRGGAEMIPVLDKGAEGLDELKQMAERSGTAMDEGTTASLTKMHEAIVELGLSIKGLGITFASSLSPAMVGLLQVCIDIVQSFNDAMKSGGMLADTMSLLGAAIKVVVTALAAVIDGFEQIWAAGVVLIDDLGHLFIGLGKSIYDAMHFNFAAAAEDIKGIGAGAQATMTEYLKSISDTNKRYRDEISKIWATATIGPEKDKKPAAPAMDLGTDKSAEIAAKDIEAQIKVMQTGLQQQKSILDQELAQHKITQSQKFQSLQDYTDDAYGTEKELLQQELGLYAQGTTQYAAVKAKLLELDAKYALDSTKIQTDAIKEQQKSYDKFFTDVQSAFNGQLKGLLSGTTSWSQAFKNILGDLVIKFIESVEKMGFEWLAGELAKTTATAAGVTARTTTEAAGAAAGSAITMTSAIKSIMSSAAQTFAGIFAFLSPVMGPTAAGPAAAGEAVVASQVAAAYEQGTPWVPADGMAMLHRGEAVIPADVNATGFGGGSGGGGDNHYWSVSAMDGQSVARFFKDNGATISKMLAGKVSLNPSLRT